MRSVEGRKIARMESSMVAVVLRPSIRKAEEYGAPARVHHRRLQRQPVPVHGVALQNVPSNGSRPDV